MNELRNLANLVSTLNVCQVKDSKGNFRANLELRVPIRSRWETDGARWPGLCIVSQTAWSSKEAAERTLIDAQRIQEEVELESFLNTVQATPLPPAPAWITGECI